MELRRGRGLGRDDQKFAYFLFLEFLVQCFVRIQDFARLERQQNGKMTGARTAGAMAAGATAAGAMAAGERAMRSNGKIAG